MHSSVMCTLPPSHVRWEYVPENMSLTIAISNPSSVLLQLVSISLTVVSANQITQHIHAQACTCISTECRLKTGARCSHSLCLPVHPSLSQYPSHSTTCTCTVHVNYLLPWWSQATECVVYSEGASHPYLSQGRHSGWEEEEEERGMCVRVNGLYWQ